MLVSQVDGLLGNIVKVINHKTINDSQRRIQFPSTFSLQFICGCAAATASVDFYKVAIPNRLKFYGIPFATCILFRVPAIEF